MILTAVIGSRDFSAAPASLPGLALTVRGYSWEAQGGPAQATITASGPASALNGLLSVLRCPVTIYSPTGEAVWWGYVRDVSIRAGAAEYGASLAGMSNAVRVAYSYVAPGETTLGERKTYPAYTTDPITEPESVALYGRKDALVSIGGATDAAAAAAAARILDTFSAPQASIEYSEDGAEGAVITCAGWWETLDWWYWRNTGTDDTATTTQIADMVTGAGQFLAGTDVITASGLTSSEYRDGDTTAQTEIVALLEQGTSGSLPLWGRVNIGRRLEVDAEPVRGANDYRLMRSGLLSDRFGTAVPVWRPVVGEWCALGDLLPVIGDLSGIVDIQTRFITGWAWRYGAGRPELTWRGQPRPFDIAATVNK